MAIWFANFSAFQAATYMAGALIALMCFSSGLSAQTKASTRTKKPAPITLEEADGFGQALSEAARNGDGAAESRLIDWEAIADAATKIPNLTELGAEREGFKKGMLGQARGAGVLIPAIHAAIQQGGNYKYLRCNLKAAVPYAFFRLQLPNGGMNYHQFFLVRKPDSQICASDLYIFLSAERMSDTIHRAWIPLASEKIKAGIGKRAANLTTMLAGTQAAAKFQELRKEQKNEEALKFYQTLPQEVRQDKSMLLLRMQAAQEVSVEAYAECIDDFRKFHPKDPALDFLLIDAYTLQKNFPEAIKCVDRTNEHVGGDAMLYIVRAKLLLQSEKIPEARQAIKDAIAAEEDLSDCYMSGLDVALADKNFMETAEYLIVLEKKFGVEWKDLREVPAFADFVQSPEYNKWTEREK